MKGCWGGIAMERAGSETLASVKTFSSTGMPAPGLESHCPIASAVDPLGVLPRVTVRTEALSDLQ